MEVNYILRPCDSDDGHIYAPRKKRQGILLGRLELNSEMLLKGLKLGAIQRRPPAQGMTHA